MAARLVQLPEMSRCPASLHSGQLIDINMSINVRVLQHVCDCRWVDLIAWNVWDSRMRRVREVEEKQIESSV